MRQDLEIDLGVRNLTARYCDAVARFDVPQFERCWAADADWVVPNVRTISGRPAIVRLFTKLREPFRYCIQELLSGVIEPAGEGSAHARWQIRELQWRADGSTSCVIGTYTDRLVLDAGQWSFAQRRFDARYRGPADLTGDLLDPP